MQSTDKRTSQNKLSLSKSLSRFSIIFLLIALPLEAVSQGCWTAVASMPQARYNLVSFAIGDTGYVITGQSSGGTFRGEFFKYDPSLNLWTQLANFPGTARTGAVGFSVNGKGYVGTGRDVAGNTNQFWEYDPIANLWTQKANYPGGNREGCTGFSVGNKGYVGMGLNGTAKTDFYEYDPLTNVWTQKANFPVAAGRHGAVGFAIGSKGYVGTGNYSGFTRTKDFWEFDPATNTWLQLADVPGPERAYAVGFSVLGIGYIGTGNQYSDFYSYDVSSNTWSTITDYGPGKREKAACFVVNDIAYVGSGFYLSIKSDWWKLDPASFKTETPVIGCDSVLFESTFYTSSTTIVTVVPGVTANGCDSIYKQPIIINNSTSVLLPTIAMCDSAIFLGMYYNNDTTLVQNLFSLVTGCDSTVTVSLIVYPSLSGSETSTICNNGSVVVNGTIFNAGNPSGTVVFSNVSPFGCDSIVTVNLNVLPMLSGSINQTICNGDSIVVNGTTYNASNPNGTEVFSNIGPNACDSTVVINLTINPVDTSVNTNQNIITANASGAIYQWLDCDNNYTEIAGETSQSYTALANGNFAVMVTENNCSDTSNCVNITGIGVEELSHRFSIYIYPNPSKGSFFVNLGSEGELKTIEVLNLLGEIIDVKQTTNAITEIDIKDGKGVFLIRCKLQGIVVVSRIVTL